jgi:hypothetical protein
MIPKPKRQQDKDYLLYIRTLPCAVHNSDCYGEVVPHHTKTKGAGGSDYATIPLCSKHHTEIHLIGKDTFMTKYGLCCEAEIFDRIVEYIRERHG